MYGSAKLHKKFFSRLELQENECILWTGPTNEKGYGYLTVSPGLIRRVHKVSWFIKHGYWPEYLMHSCDVRNCVALKHLSEGNHRLNVDDMVAKDRHARGERNAAHKLTDLEILEIRRLCVEDKISYEDLAKKFDVASVTIRDVHFRRSWKHLGGAQGKKQRAFTGSASRTPTYNVGDEWLTMKEIAERIGSTTAAVASRIRKGVKGEALLAAKSQGARQGYPYKRKTA